MSCNDIRKHLQAAEEELRLAFVESLEQRNDENLSMLVECLNSVKDVLACTPVRKTDNLNDYYRNKAEWDFNLDSDHLRPGGDLDALDNLIKFPDITLNTTDPTVTFTPDPGVWGGSSDDIITFGDKKDDDKGPDIS